MELYCSTRLDRSSTLSERGLGRVAGTPTIRMLSTVDDEAAEKSFAAPCPLLDRMVD